jgi:large conductance mechanosensitive channel
VNDIIMPPIGLVLGRVNFTDLFLALDGIKYDSLAKAQEAGAATINYGLFINNILDFLIVAFFLFLIIRQVNRLRRQPAPAPVALTSKDCPFCKTSIPIQASCCPNCTAAFVLTGFDSPGKR